MTTTGVKSIILIIAVGILIGGCGGSNTSTAALQPHATNTVKPAATQVTVARVSVTPLLGDLDEDHSAGGYGEHIGRHRSVHRLLLRPQGQFISTGDVIRGVIGGTGRWLCQDSGD